MTNSTSNYGPAVTWEQLQEQTRIYYTGCSSDPAGGGIIIKRLEKGPNQGHRSVKIEMDDGREWQSIELTAFQVENSRRFWLESDWHEHKRRAIAALARVGAPEAAPAMPENNAASIGVRELATILAALRLFQRLPSEMSEPENDIATDGGEFAALSLAEIDALCERLNAKPIRRSYFEGKAKARAPEPVALAESSYRHGVTIKRTSTFTRS